MMSACKNKALWEQVSNAAMAAVFLGIVMLVGCVELKAQSDEMFDKSYAFIGNWNAGINNPDGQDRGNCGGRLGDYGEKLLNCSMPVDQLPLNKRGEAWMKYVDARQSPSLAECSQVAVPPLLGSGAYISAYQNRLVFMTADPNGLVTRDVWMDGRKPPEAGVLFQHGYSIGHWDGDDLVVEDTNFTFDPDGIDDHLHMASSVRKKVTERYHIIDENTMRLIITLEDPTFLTRPFTYAILYNKRPGGLVPVWRACDPSVARNEVYEGYAGNKYPDENETKK
jgi:hypothetical protein